MRIYWQVKTLINKPVILWVMGILFFCNTVFKKCSSDDTQTHTNTFKECSFFFFSLSGQVFFKSNAALFAWLSKHSTAKHWSIIYELNSRNNLINKVQINVFASMKRNNIKGRKRLICLENKLWMHSLRLCMQYGSRINLHKGILHSLEINWWKSV